MPFYHNYSPIDLFFIRLGIFLFYIPLVLLINKILFKKYSNNKKYIKTHFIIFATYYSMGILVAILRNIYNHNQIGISNIYLDDRFFIQKALSIFSTGYEFNAYHVTYSMMISFVATPFKFFFSIGKIHLASIAVLINSLVYSYGFIFVYKLFLEKFPNTIEKSPLRFILFFIPITISLGVVPLRDTLVCGFALLSFALLFQKRYILMTIMLIFVFLLRPISLFMLTIILIISYHICIKHLNIKTLLGISFFISLIVIINNLTNFTSQESTTKVIENHILKGHLIEADQIKETQGLSGINLAHSVPPIFRVILIPFAYFLAPYPPKFRFQIPVMQGGEYAFETFFSYNFESYLNLIIFTSFILLFINWKILPPLIKTAMIAAILSTTLSGLITFEARHKILLWPLAYFASIYSISSGLWQKKYRTLISIIFISQILMTLFINYILLT